MLMNMLSPNDAMAEQVSFNDPDIFANYIMYLSPNGTCDVRGHRVRPAEVAEPLPAMLVIHENRGLNPYIENVAHRIAKAGFMAIAPTGRHSLAGIPRMTRTAESFSGPLMVSR